MSTCSGLAALDHANTKHTKGYATSGIVCTTCRHEFILPEGAGPLQKGERLVFNSTLFICTANSMNRFANTDYVTKRSTSHSPETKKVASYDIVCQWHINLRERLKALPFPNAESLYDLIVAWVVPKFHSAAHIEICRTKFSLNYEPGVGRSDMEGPERTWFGLQGGGSTKDQGPGYWSDAMDDKFGHWNWSKLIRLGEVLVLFFPTIISPCFQERYLRRSILMPAYSPLHMWMSLLLFALISPKNSLNCGPLEFSRGSLIELSRIHISTPRLVRLIVCCMALLNYRVIRSVGTGNPQAFHSGGGAGGSQFRDGWFRR